MPGIATLDSIATRMRRRAAVANARRRRAATSRSSSAAASPEPMPRWSSARLPLDSRGACACRRVRRTDPLRHRFRRDRAHRTTARGNAGRRPPQALLRAGARRQRRRAPDARQASPPATQRRKRASSCFRASSRWARSRPPTSRSRATATARRASSAMRMRASVLDHARIADIARVADARSNARIGGGAGAADVDRGAARGHAALRLAAVSPARRHRQPAARVRQRRSAKPSSTRLAQAHYAHLVAARRRVRSLSLPVGEYASARRFASRTSSF